MKADYVLRQGTTLPSISAALEDDSGDPLSLTGATVEFVVRVPYREEVFRSAAVVTDIGNAIVQYDWRPIDVTDPGTYHAYWLLTYATGTMKVPQEGYLTLIVES
jgi:hypothetical protein